MSYNQFVYDIPAGIGEPPELPANCVVHFRPLKKWKGEFGFDWLRVGKEGQTGDTGMFGDEHYAKIMGKYKTADGDVCNDKDGWEEYTDKESEPKKTKPCTFKNSVDEYDTTNYEHMCNEYFPYRFTIPWKMPDPKKTPNVGWKRERDKTEYTYHVPVLTIRENQTITLELHVELEKDKNKTPPKRITVRQYDGFSEGTGHLEVTDSKVKPQNGKYEITVKCTRTFTCVQLLEAIAVYDNPEGGEVNKICGMLRVLPNSITPKVNILIVSVKVDIGNDESTGKKLTGEIDELRKILRQSYTEIENIKDDIVVKIVNPGNFSLSKTDNAHHFTDTQGLYTAIITALENNNKIDVMVEYADYIRIYILDEKCKKVSQTSNVTMTNSTFGETRGIDVLLFKGRDMPTIAHEVLHTLTLQHPFVSIDGVPQASKAYYTYKAKSTENIMDYVKDKGISTWFWQWRVIWEKLNVEIQDVPEVNLNSLPLTF